MDSIKATCNIYFCDYGTVLVDINKTWQLLQGFIHVFQNKIPWLSLTFPVNHTTFSLTYISAQISVRKLHH